MSRISARGFAVASATAVTTVGAVVGVAQGGAAQPAGDAEATASDSTLLADLPVGQQAEVQTASLTQQADVQANAADTTARKSAEEAARKQAAKDAVAKQKAAKEAKDAADQAKKALQEAKERAETKTQSTRASTRDVGSFPQQSSYSVSEVQAIARQIVPAGQFQCFSNIVNHESTWNYQATNPTSGAYGLVQAYPAGKMASAGADWRTNPATQIKWGLNYMNERYGSPCDAWGYWQANGSY
ncbi:transglycosylase SLT domain-containing protein [Streptomyces sp. NPDC002888]|uniref:aggregation-promoting factor C-terminal-like domain-containing protein n=1 Tax=Streptomyces sp. NPDC002888 TaxID=3364668 RepID=UPI0036D08F82